MIVVCDTSSLIRLRKGGVLKHVKKVFDEVWIPYAVFQECRDIATASEIIRLDFKTIRVKNVLAIGLGTGERETISLAKERNIENILIDDEKGFKKAVEHDLKPIRSFDLLLIYKALKVIPSVKISLDRMIANKENIDTIRYETVLEKAKELQ